MGTILGVIVSLFGLAGEPELRNGDIVFQESQSSQSKAIREGTNSPITHMGIIHIRNGKPYVYEAVSPHSKPKPYRVGLTPYKSWVNRGKGKRVWVKRLSEKVNPLSPKTLKKMQAVGQRYKGKRYDKLFQWDDRKIYCSELVFDIYDKAVGVRLGKVQQVKDLNLKPKSVQKLIKARLGKRLNLKEKIITPVSIFDDPRLVTIVEP